MYIGKLYHKILARSVRHYRRIRKGERKITEPRIAGFYPAARRINLAVVINSKADAVIGMKQCDIIPADFGVINTHRADKCILCEVCIRSGCLHFGCITAGKYRQGNCRDDKKQGDKYADYFLFHGKAPLLLLYFIILKYSILCKRINGLFFPWANITRIPPPRQKQK